MFPDDRVETAVRNAAHIPDGPITSEQAPLVTTLNVEGQLTIGMSRRPESIVSLEGVQCLTGLTAINSMGCVYTDFAPLASLRELQTVTLGDSWGFGVLPHWPPLPALKNVALFYEAITDISSLSTLSHLETLDLSANDFRDVSALSGLTRLKQLNLHWNHIADLRRSPICRI